MDNEWLDAYMVRFIAVNCDDGVSRIHDAENGEWAKIEFHGPNSFEMAWGCARQWNNMLMAQAQAMDEWLEADVAVHKMDGMFGDLPSKDDIEAVRRDIEKLELFSISMVSDPLICMHCGSGLLKGEHIASYPPCFGKDKLHNMIDPEQS